MWRPGCRPPPSASLPASSDRGAAAFASEYQHVASEKTNHRNRPLPIAAFREEFLCCVERYRSLVVVGETGSGKTTQMPIYLHENGWTDQGMRIVCTQPRRLAAVSVASRVANELGTQVGDGIVGYAVRFDKSRGPRAKISFMTDNTLFQAAKSDPLLTEFSVVIIDEAHERTVYTDALLALLRLIQRKRHDLRVIVSSATLDAGKFKAYLEPNATDDQSKDACAILRVEGRQHPIKVHFTKRSVADYIQAAVHAALGIHKKEKRGDILIFLPKPRDVNTAVSMLRTNGDATIAVLPLYASLPADDMYKVFEPAPRGARKIIVSTPVAETSVTLSGIVFVVDSMFVETSVYDPVSSQSARVVQPISKSQAHQRAGRAGRICPGKCFRLCREVDFKKLRKNAMPEMQRHDLVGLVLHLKAMCIDDVVHFPFLSAPPVESLLVAYELLFALGAIDREAQLTSFGSKLAELPVEPKLGTALLTSIDMGCSEEMVSLAAMLHVESAFMPMRAGTKRARAAVDAGTQLLGAREGDHCTLVNAYNAWIEESGGKKWCAVHGINRRAMLRAREIRHNIERCVRRYIAPGNEMQSCCQDSDTLLRCIASGFFANAAKLRPDGAYASVRDSCVMNIHPESVLCRFGALRQHGLSIMRLLKPMHRICER